MSADSIEAKIHVQLTTDALNVEKAMNLLPDQITNNGAICTFHGITRQWCDGKRVESLFYEAYEELAQKQLMNICQDLAQRYPTLEHLIVMHRLGFSPIGDTSVIVLCASVHRAEAFSACEELMDRLKAEVAIWKRETYRLTDGSTVTYEGPTSRCKCSKSKWKINSECKENWGLQ